MKKKIISVLTATRAEYGLLKPIIKKLQVIETMDVRVVVTGAHLSPEFGLTYKEIEQDGILIDQKIDMLVSADTPAAISKSMGLAMIGFADYYQSLQPDMLMILGDRYETLAVANVAINFRIPIVHLYGGETTEGAIDEVIRHAITKLSYLHFTSTEVYRQRIIQLGENPKRVFNVGATGIENIQSELLMTRKQLQQTLSMDIQSHYAVVTFHPVTLEEGRAEQHIDELLKACEQESRLSYLFTKANADAEGRIINQKIKEFVARHKNSQLVDSLGLKRYLSAVKHSAMVIGNSSSGIIEVPSLGIPTVNIGKRQKGRIQAKSIINCKPNQESIQIAISQAYEAYQTNRFKHIVNPYGDGKTSNKMVSIIQQWLQRETIDIKKSFYDLSVKTTS